MKPARTAYPQIINFARCRRELVVGPAWNSGPEAFDAWMREQAIANRIDAAPTGAARSPCQTTDEIAADLDLLIEELEAEVDRLVLRASPDQML